MLLAYVMILNPFLYISITNLPLVMVTKGGNVARMFELKNSKGGGFTLIGISALVIENKMLGC